MFKFICFILHYTATKGLFTDKILTIFVAVKPFTHLNN
jgi:hypothetical protein